MDDFKDIYSRQAMPSELETELRELESSLSSIEKEFPAIARDAARKRFAYEIAKAEAIDSLEHRPIPEGSKKPTVAAIEAAADLIIRNEMEATRNATAELEIAKTVLDSLKSRLTSIQTRSKMMGMEMGLAR